MQAKFICGLVLMAAIAEAVHIPEHYEAEKAQSSESIKANEGPSLEEKGKPTVNIWKVEDVYENLPTAPEDYPEPLKGIIWMDQIGYYGHSDIGKAAPDGALSFGDGANMLDKETGTLRFDIAGPAWQWFNNFEGYGVWKFAKMSSFHYKFQFSKNYTHAQISPSFDVAGGFLGSVSVPQFLSSFTMELQTPPPGACPPGPNATNKEASVCAKWKRVSKMGNVGKKSATGELLYYAFEIVDKDGNKVQPYFDKYVEWATENSQGSAKFAWWMGVNGDKELLEEPGTCFTGLDASKSSAKEDANNEAPDAAPEEHSLASQDEVERKSDMGFHGCNRPFKNDYEKEWKCANIRNGPRCYLCPGWFASRSCCAKGKSI